MAATQPLRLLSFKQSKAADQICSFLFSQYFRLSKLFGRLAVIGNMISFLQSIINTKFRGYFPYISVLLIPSVGSE